MKSITIIENNGMKVKYKVTHETDTHIFAESYNLIIEVPKVGCQLAYTPVYVVDPHFNNQIIYTKK